jgi:hypothetical protein
MSDAFTEGRLPHGDLPLLDGEREDIRDEATEVVGEAWLFTPNANFGGRTPEEAIRLGYAHLVRNNLRLIKYIGST